MSQSTAANPTVTRSGNAQTFSPTPAVSQGLALQPQIFTSPPTGAQTVTPDPA